MSGRRGVRVAVVVLIGLLPACSSTDDDANGASSSAATTAAVAPPSPPASVPTTASPTTASPTTGSPVTGEADDSFESVVTDAVGDTPGGVDVLRRLDGKVDHVAAGIADADGTELTPGQPFRIGSVSKTFVATMVMQLVDEGRVELDQPLSTYLPDAALGGSNTVRQLLSHRSGLPNYTDVPTFFPESYADLDHWYTPDELLEFVADATPSEPGEFEYSNTNYVLLGQLIEALDQRSLSDSLRVRIAEPLGLTSTVLPTEAAPLAVMPVGAWGADLEDGQPDTPYNSIASGAWAAGAIISTADELLVFLDALFTEQLTTPESLAEMVDVQPAGPDGYGLGILAIDVGEIKGFGHTGGIPGFTSVMLYDPDDGDVLIGLKNNPAIDTDPILERAGQP